MKNQKKEKVPAFDWIIHFVTDYACQLCGNNDLHFKPNLCNFHTHGMRELYNHPEFQLVLNIDFNIAGYILNKLGLMVKEGRRFKAGEAVSGIGICDLTLFEATDNSKPVLRVILPDPSYRLPDDENCEHPYNLQYLSTEDLML